MNIYYFSGTGNSLYAARKIANVTGGKLISIPKAVKNEIHTNDTDAIGIIFPIYFASNKDGIPLIVKQFINGLTDISDKYIFSVGTCGYMPANTMGNIEKLIKRKGGKLSAGFVLNMSVKSLKSELANKAMIISKVSETDKKSGGNFIPEYDKKLSYIAACVKERKTLKTETRSFFKKVVHIPLEIIMKPAFWLRYSKLSGKKNLNFWKLVPNCDNAFSVSGNCSSCGTCEKICPVGNIKITEGKPYWQNHCENCLACYSWCPSGAIGGELVKYNEKIHHPEIKVKDMLNKI